MALRFCDGFDLASPGLVRIKYAGYNASFDQDATFAGRDGIGQAFEIVNTAFGYAEYRVDFDTAAATWGFHVDIQLTGSRGSTSDLFKFRASSSATPTQLIIRILSDGRFRIVNGFDGSTLATSTATLGLNTWATLEVLASFGSGNLCTVRLDGVTIASASGYGDGATPDQFAFRFEQFGPPGLVLDNLIVYDGNVDGSPFGTGAFLGRMRITSHVPVSDAVERWAAVPGPHAWAMLNDAIGRTGGSPDGDLTYVTPAGTSQAQLETLATTDCFGKIYGLAVNVAMRPAGAQYPMSVIVQPSTTPATLASLTPAAIATYRTYQALSVAVPGSGVDWTDAIINGAYWGLQTSSAALTRVSALYLEKLVSLTPQPFDCGGGSYSF